MKIKQFFALGIFAMFANYAVAQDVFSVSDVTIAPGGTATLTFSINATETPVNAQVNFKLPEGITVAVDDDDYLLYELGDCPADDAKNNMDGLEFNDAGEYVFTLMNKKSKEFASKSGILFTCTLKADETASGELTGEVTYVEVGGVDGAFAEFNDLTPTFKITVEAPEIPFVEPDPLSGTLISSVFYGENPVLINGSAHTSEGYPFYFDNGWKPADSYMALNRGALEITNPAAGNFMLMLLDWFSVKEQYDYKVRIFYTSTVAGKVNFTFGSWGSKVDASDVAIEASTDAWKELVIPFEAVGIDVTDNTAHLLLHFGLEGTIAIKKVEIYETEPAVPIPDPVWSNIVVNGNCATADNSAFSYKIKKQYYKAQIVDGDGVEGSRGVVVTSDDSPANDWDTQFFITINHKFAANEKFKLKMDYRADLEGDATATGQFQSHKACAAEMPEAGLTEADEVTDPETQHIGTYIGNISGFSNLTFKNDWQTFEGEGKATADMQSICLNLSVLRSSTKYYFDNIIVEIDENKATPEDLAVIGEVANEGEDVVTGIKSLNTAEKNGALYNLAGQKVDKNYKGIVIVNGKKMMMK